MPTLEESWLPYARTLGFESEAQMLETLYLEEGLSLSDIGQVVAKSRIAVRRRLIMLGVPLRDRGGPNRTGKRRLTHISDLDLKFKSPDLIAAEQGVHVSTVFSEKRLRKALKGEIWNSLSSAPKIISKTSELGQSTISSLLSSVSQEMREEEDISSSTGEELNEEM